ncbi:hypothetical protein DFH94DRAFT_742437 [Russula ochroleuca]|uniref:NAD(P)-binding domain-containing protein n=1 Tax=Russula ochroleuca TaxID=152965 RepID=A0A9P5T953_9AGAM|nr:hypothetical protein DFH94DRAFT_742437 [Russula ochroleuca]
MKVLLTGATGVAGLGILRSLLADNGVSQVTYLGRRPLPPWVVLPGGTSTDGASPTHPKLSTIEHKDFLTYPPAIQEMIAEHDACIWALGISASGLSEAKYTEITVGYLSAFLDVLKDKAVGTAGSPFRVVFITMKGADSTEKSRILFVRVKGRAENSLIKAVEESSGRLGASILRPGYFYPSKAYPQDAPNQRGLILRITDKLLGAPLSIFYPAAVISVEEMDQFALEAARGKWEAKSGLSSIFDNAEMKNLVKSV